MDQGKCLRDRLLSQGLEHTELLVAARHPMSIQINLLPATPSDTLSALDEVKDFDVTDMGRGGLHRWTYRVMEEPALSDELERAANARSYGSVDSVTFQPCPSFKSQDRYHVDHWSLPDGVWTFTAIFDGGYIYRVAFF